MNIYQLNVDRQNQEPSIDPSKGSFSPAFVGKVMNTLETKIVQIKLKQQELLEKKILLKINQIGQSTDIESQEETDKAIKQLDLLAAQLQQPGAKKDS
ncbi:MAG: hypothetical protein L3J52_08025 [Proteobacteria bacterium]|nr:hypothetical protein [Pseudomonadota bacterium]